MEKKSRRRKILSVDGGGIRGLIPALVLSEIEKRTGRPIAELFDLMVGTSSGGLIVLCLNVCREDGRPKFAASQVAEVFVRDSRTIFYKSFLRRFLPSWALGFFGPMYDASGLESVLERLLGEKLLHETHTRVMVSAYDIEQRCPLFLKSWRDSRNTVSMRRAARATTAAPTYFSPIELSMGEGDAAVADGGFVANDPVMCAYAECVELWPEDSPFLVSIGTGAPSREIPFSKARRWGKLGWFRAPIIEYFLDGASDSHQYQLERVLSDAIRIQRPLGDASERIDDATPGNIAALQRDAKSILDECEPEIDRICSELLAT